MCTFTLCNTVLCNYKQKTFSHLIRVSRRERTWQIRLSSPLRARAPLASTGPGCCCSRPPPEGTWAVPWGRTDRASSCPAGRRCARSPATAWAARAARSAASPVRADTRRALCSYRSPEWSSTLAAGNGTAVSCNWIARRASLRQLAGSGYTRMRTAHSKATRVHPVVQRWAPVEIDMWKERRARYKECGHTAASDMLEDWCMNGLMAIATSEAGGGNWSRDTYVETPEVSRAMGRPPREGGHQRDTDVAKKCSGAQLYTLADRLVRNGDERQSRNWCYLSERLSCQLNQCSTPSPPHLKMSWCELYRLDGRR